MDLVFTMSDVEEYITTFNGRDRNDAFMQSVADEWSTVKKAKAFPWEFYIHFINVSDEAVYGVHVTPTPEGTYRILIDRHIVSLPGSANIYLETDADGTTIHIEQLYGHNTKDHQRMKYAEHWYGYIPRAMLLTKWIAVNLGYTRLTLDDGWDHRLLQDGHHLLLGKYTYLDSYAYKELFKELVNHRMEEFDKYPKTLRTKILRDYNEAHDEKTIENIIQHGYYGRFNFTHVPGLQKHRMQVLVDEMKVTRDAFDVPRHS